MKIWMKKFGIVAASAAALTTLVSAVPLKVNADVSRVVYFSIQSDTGCGLNTAGAQYYTAVSLMVNNLGTYPTDVTIDLYKKDGTTYTGTGVNVNGIVSDITPGTSQTINGNESIQYQELFGGAVACSERPTFGKITVNSSSGLVVASGDVAGQKRVTSTTDDPQQNLLLYQSSTIAINNGQPF